MKWNWKHADYTVISLKCYIHPTIKMGGLSLHRLLTRHFYLYSNIVSYHKIPQAPTEFYSMCLYSCIILCWQDSGSKWEII